jgi:O-glycosyl hydrolase
MRNLLILLVCILFINVNAQQTVVIKPTVEYQTIDGFGASDCINGEYVGRYWSLSQKESAAKFLFDQTFKSNLNPNGIGLSLWRFNIGSGSDDYPDCKVAPNDRRTGCYLDANGNFDWTRQPGQRWFLSKAKSYGVQKYVAFSNSPLIIYTRNGKSYCPGDRKANIQVDKYGKFADYYMSVIKHIKDSMGIEFDYFSPVNEPQWAWSDSTSEGSQFQNADIKKLCVSLDSCIVAKKLNTKLFVSESGSWSHLYTKSNSSSEIARNQIEDFYNPTSVNYIGNLSSVAKIMTAHSYWSDGNNADLRNIRAAAYTKAQSYNLGLYQTEWCMLSLPDSLNGFPKTMAAATEMDIALWQAKVIHSDLAYANVSSWSYWTAMDKEGWGSKNRFMLLKLNPAGGNKNSVVDFPGTIESNKSLWALGNFSLFIRPGFKRVQMIGADNLAKLVGTSYINPEKTRIVSVYVNMDTAAVDIKPAFSDIPNRVIKTNTLYRTDATYSLINMRITADYVKDKVITIPKRSIITLVYDLTDVTAVPVISTDVAVDIVPNPIKGNELNLKMPDNLNNKHLNISVFSVDGRKVVEIPNTTLYNGCSLVLPTNIKSGVYLLQLKDQKSNWCITKRFQKL